MKIVIATRNKKKEKEIKDLLKDLNIEVITLDKFKKSPNIEEDGLTFADNAVKKALAIADYTGLLTLADDSGLEVEALNGAPGVFSARFAGKKADDLKNNEKLLKLLKGLPKSGRKARFTCAIAIAVKTMDSTFRNHTSARAYHADRNFPFNKGGLRGISNANLKCDVPKVVKIIQESTVGYITESRLGKSGFGYDPVFIPRGYNKTFAQLGGEVKNKISHRAKALKKAKIFIEKFSLTL